MVDYKDYLIGNIFKRNVRFSPNKEFLIDWITGKGEKRLTYSQTAQNVYKICRALDGAAVQKGDIVAIIGYNIIEGIEVVIGSTLIGYIYGWQNPDLPEDALITIVNDRMAAKVVFFEDRYREKIIKMMPMIKSTQHFINLDGPSDKEKGIISYKEFTAGYSPEEVEVEVKPDELHCLYMSSGTTGIPKAAMWTHGAAWIGSMHSWQYYGQGPEDISAYISPSFWSTWMPANFWPTLLAGASTVVFDGRHNLELICEGITKERCTFGVVPSFVWLELASWPVDLH